MANEYKYNSLPKAYIITNAIETEVQDAKGNTVYNPMYTADDAGHRGVKEVIAYDELKEGEKFDFLLDKDGNFVTDDDNKIQVIVTRKYKNTARVVQFYKTNDFIVLNPGDSVTVEAKYSSEAAYYESLAGDDFTVVAATTGA